MSGNNLYRRAAARLWALFAIFALTQVSVYGSQFMPASGAGLALRLSRVGLILPLGYALVLFTLLRWNVRYKNAALCALAAALINLSSAYIAAGLTVSSAWAISIMLSLISICAEYFEYGAHSALLAMPAPKLSLWWQRLWRWYLWSIAAALVSGLLLSVIPAAGSGLLLAASVVSLVTRLGKLVLLGAGAWALSRAEA